jgi:small subunit ribosomal protein S1
MTDPENPETNTPAAAPAENAPAPAAAPENPAPAAEAAPAAGDDHHDEHDGDDGGEEEGAAGESGAVATVGEGGEKKKRRRRRRKKKGPGAPGLEGAPVEGSEGAPAEAGGEHAGGEKKEQRPPKPKREHRPERERPAFNVGDVVFGKVLEVTEDALYADLAGKAKAIFDLRELLITDEDIEEYEKAAKKEADEIAAARAASAAGKAAAAGAPAESGEAPVVSESTEIQTVDAAAETPTDVTPPSVEQPAGEIEVAAEDGAPSGAAQAAAEPPGLPGPAEGGGVGGEAPDVEENKPQLPHVVLEPGAPFVGLVHNDGGRGGLVVLTHHPKRVQKAKPIVSEASKNGTMVFGLVTGTIKGGVEVDVDGLRAFAPASHVELRPGADLSHLVGKRLPFAVTQYAKRGRDVVLSRRGVLEEEAKTKREEALKNLEMGSIVIGVVRTVVPFGAFIDVGGIEGLVPLSEMSHNRADQPKDVFKLGDTCKVKVLRLDERGKLWLSRKAAIDDPWNEVATKYAQGTKHKGKVARLQPFGAFIELEPGIDGLIHTADLSVKRIEHPEEIVKVGDEIDVVVASVDARQHRIALHPAPTGEAANETPQRIQVHKTVKVVVVNAEQTGLTVRVLGATGRNARGFITASATGTTRGTELRKHFPVGKELDAKIIEQDPRRGELKLSIKALNEETERNAYQQYRAQVKREAKFGTFADLLAKRNEPTK